MWNYTIIVSSFCSFRRPSRQAFGTGAVAVEGGGGNDRHYALGMCFCAESPKWKRSRTHEGDKTIRNPLPYEHPCHALRQFLLPPCRELRFVTAIWPPSHRSFLGALDTRDWRSWNRFIKRKQGPDLRYLWWGYLERVIFWICSDLGFLKPFLATS